MFQHKHKSGISFEQAKKDAKKAAKKGGIQLSKAQDDLAFAHSRSTWAQATLQSKRKIKCKVGSEGEELVLPIDSSLTVLRGMSGSGKSVMMFHLIRQFLELGIPVTYISYREPFHEEGSFSLHGLYAKQVACLQKRYRHLLTIYDTWYHRNIDEFRISGGVLFIDETPFLLKALAGNKESSASMRHLIQASKHTFIADMDCGLTNDDPLKSAFFDYSGSKYFLYFKHTQEALEKLFGEKSNGVHRPPAQRLVGSLNVLPDSESTFVLCGPDMEPKLCRLKYDDLLI